MTALLLADRCPVCTKVHGEPSDWPQCPQHGHFMHELHSWPDQIIYACPAHRCTRTHTRTERATMTDTTTAALALHEGQSYWDARQLAALQQLGIRDVTKADLQMFLHYCQRTGLDPFSKQIYLIARNTKDGVRQTVQVGIDGYRVIAQRAAKRDGVTLNYGPTSWYDRNGKDYPVWVSDDIPAAAAVIVYRDGKPFPGVARFESFAQRNKAGELTGQWRTMPDHMIGKCAEAQALRKAFPHDLAGIVTDDEAPATYGQRRPNLVTALAQPLPVPRDNPEPEPVDAQTLQEAVSNEFDRLGVVDHEEQAVYAYALAGVDDHDLKLGQEDLNRVLSALVDCETIAHIREITGQTTLDDM